MKLARWISSRELWAVLATLAIQYQELNTAEVAYAALDELPKVQFICHLKQLTDSVARQSELALFRHAYREAESILLGNGKPAEAIQQAIRMYRYDRALEIANKYGIDKAAIAKEREADLKRMGISSILPARSKEALDAANEDGEEELIQGSGDLAIS